MEIYTKKQKSLASVSMLFVAIIWGYAFVVVKDSLDVVPPIYMLAYRFSIAAVGSLIIFYRKLKLINKYILRDGAVCGAVFFLAYLSQTIGCKYTTAGKNAFLTTIYVVVVPFLHWLINKKKPDIYAVMAAIIAIVGIGMLSLNGDYSIGIGDTLTLLCGFLFALHVVCVSRCAGRSDTIALTIVQLATAAILAWVFAPLLEGSLRNQFFSTQVIVSMLYLGLGSSLAALLLQTTAQKYLAASMAAILMSLESLFGALFSALFLGETMTLRMIVGCVLLLFAVILAETKFDFLPFNRKKERGSHV